MLRVESAYGSQLSTQNVEVNVLMPSVGTRHPKRLRRAGPPTALEFTARAYNENAILAAAKADQQRADWHTKTPKVE